MANESKRIVWLLESVTDEIDKLTDWEQSFVISVEKHFKDNGSLTDNQYNKLEEVYERVQDR